MRRLFIPALAVVPLVLAAAPADAAPTRHDGRNTPETTGPDGGDGAAGAAL